MGFSDPSTAEPEKTVLQTVSEQLAALETPIVLSDAEIKAGMTFSSLNTSSTSVSITYTHKNSSYTVAVANALAKAVVDNMAGKLPGVKVTSEATGNSETSGWKKYLLIALAADFVLACGLPFIDEIISDEVYDKKDIEALGCEGFELSVSKK